MSIRCPGCGREYDVTLFEFGRTVRCVCGVDVDAREPHRPAPPGRRNPPTEERPPDPPPAPPPAGPARCADGS